VTYRGKIDISDVHNESLKELTGLYPFKYPVNASIAFDTYRLSSRM
jgi:hypothetical protein